jgi:excisionase family DNA binding protein
MTKRIRSTAAGRPTEPLTPGNVDQVETLLTGTEVAKILHVSRSAAYGLMRTGSLRAVRINRSVRVRPTDLERFIAAHCDPEPPEVRGNGGAL